MTQFYVLQPVSECAELVASVSFNVLETWERKPCPKYHMLKTRRTGPYVIEDAPKPVDDFVWSWYGDLFSNSRAEDVLAAENISGCAFDQATVLPHKENESPRHLWEVRVTGFAGFVNGSAPAEISARCEECGVYSYQFSTPFARLLDEAKWDGSDVFTIWPFPKLRLCTGRVVRLLAQAALTGIVAIPIEEYELVSGSAAPGLPAASLSEPALSQLLNDRDYIRAIRPVHQREGAGEFPEP